MTHALTVADLSIREGEPRIKDLRLGELLGYDRTDRVRRVIKRNEDELACQGEVCRNLRQTSAKGGRPETEFYLNEVQAVLVCMFARTPQAKVIRAQIAEVFLAWRHGELAKVPVRAAKPAAAQDRWAKLERRMSQIEKLLTLQGRVETPEYARAVAYAPNVLFLDHDDGRRKIQRNPRWWYDLPVREAMIAHHRQMTVDQALTLLVDQFGRKRAPSRSGLGRFWLKLDRVRAAS